MRLFLPQSKALNFSLSPSYSLIWSDERKQSKILRRFLELTVIQLMSTKYLLCAGLGGKNAILSPIKRNSHGFLALRNCARRKVNTTFNFFSHVNLTVKEKSPKMIYPKNSELYWGFSGDGSLGFRVSEKHFKFLLLFSLVLATINL